MSKLKTIRFNEVPLGAFFSPAVGEVGSQFVYRRRGIMTDGRNGVCLKLGTRDEEGIFYPNDRVTLVNVRPH